MNVGLYQAAAALSANSRWQEIISENLAASSIPGYKKQQITQAAVKAGLMPSSGNIPQNFMMPQASASTSFAPGEMKFTGSKSDAAIDGKGFFEVEAPNGAKILTRDGEFQINSKGQLVTKEGYAVMGEGGPIQEDRNNSSEMTISSDGTVSQGPELLGKLKVNDFAKPELLTQLSGAYFQNNNPAVKAQPADATVRQGYLESSNASTLGEMAQMMVAMRTFESSQKLVQIQDDRLNKAITELGAPPS